MVLQVSVVCSFNLPLLHTILHISKMIYVTSVKPVVFKISSFQIFPNFIVTYFFCFLLNQRDTYLLEYSVMVR